MSVRPVTDPAAASEAAAPAIATVLDARARDIGGFSVRRLLPAAARRRVGPFVFFDHMGPAVFGAGQGIDVRPHPHIGLATVTYLFEGEIVHRDSLGSLRPVQPGAVNWMIAGRGIVHSERTSPELRRAASRVHGLQLWVALPQQHEECEPAFHHVPASDVPALRHGAVRLRLLAGSAYGTRSPVPTLSPLFYLDAELPAGSELEVPSEHAERAAYVVEGRIECEAERAESGRMLVFAAAREVRLRAATDARVVLLGGAELDGPRHVWWNFVSSSRERIERAAEDWKAGRFPRVPGDDVEFVPLPE